MDQNVVYLGWISNTCEHCSKPLMPSWLIKDAYNGKNENPVTIHGSCLLLMYQINIILHGYPSFPCVSWFQTHDFSGFPMIKIAGWKFHHEPLYSSYINKSNIYCYIGLPKVFGMLPCVS